MNKAWSERERRETRRMAAMMGATMDEPDNDEDPSAQSAEHERLAAFCRKLTAS